MDRRLFEANQITPTFKRKWTVLVQVIERRNARKKTNGPLYRNYVVTDTQGTKVPIVVFDGNVAHFSHTLLPFNRYYVSNASVSETPAPYRVLEYPYTWTLYRQNLVEPYDEPIPPSLPCPFQFDRFTDFYRYADQERSICIKAFVVQALPVQEGSSSSTRDFVIINEEMIPILMRAWDDLLVDTDVNIYAKYKTPTLIVAYGLKVTTLKGLSLKTKTGAYILENPPLEDQTHLNEWYAAHESQITTLVQTGAYLDPATLFHPPRPAEILPLDFALASIENAKAIWTEGKLSYLPGQRRLWFEACEKCLTPLDVDIDWKIKCSVCQEFTRVCVRSDIAVTLCHGQTSVEASIKSPELDKLLPFTGNELKLAAEKEEPLTKEVEEALKDKHVICFMKYYERESRGILLRRYPLVKIYTQDEIEAYHTDHHEAVDTHIAVEPPINLQHIGSSTSAPQKEAAKEFFTPSTKAILKEVSANQSVTQQHEQQPSSSKRMLPFSRSSTGAGAHSSSIDVSASFSPERGDKPAPINESSNPLQTTPSKKPRGKEKQK